MPLDHPFATKRPPIDTHYFETYNRDNVRLVDVRRTPIEEVTPRGVRTSEAEFELDTLVFATGFDALTGPLLNIDIMGTDGIPLREKWAAGPRLVPGSQCAGKAEGLHALRRRFRELRRQVCRGGGKRLRGVLLRGRVGLGSPGGRTFAPRNRPPPDRHARSE
jgi:hypothetical protein